MLSLRRAGESARSIRWKLAAKGIDPETASAALDRDEPGNDDFAAAIAYARRRRLGPFRTEADRAARRERDMAALARKGFGLDTRRAAIGATDALALEERERFDQVRSTLRSRTSAIPARSATSAIHTQRA